MANGDGESLLTVRGICINGIRITRVYRAHTEGKKKLNKNNNFKTFISNNHTHNHRSFFFRVKRGFK